METMLEDTQNLIGIDQQIMTIINSSEVQQLIITQMEIDRKDSLMSDHESEKLQIFFCARNLADLDIVTVTDSFLVVYKQQPNHAKTQVLKTKVYWNDLNPDYAETLITDFLFQVRQKLILEVYHQSNPPKLVGLCEVTIGEIFGSRSKGLRREIFDARKRSKGQILLKCQKIEKGSNKIIQFNLRAFDLLNGKSPLDHCFPSGGTFFKILKIRNDVQFLLYESQPNQGKNLRFYRTVFNQKRLCNNNLDQLIIIKFYKSSYCWAPKEIGKAQFTIKDIGKQKIMLNNRGKTAGYITFQQLRRYTKHQFTDFMIAGMEIALVIDIDFTASNGIPCDKNSLHHFTATKKSHYQQALFQATNILMDYDADKLVPVYGFGAKVRMPNFSTGNCAHHCFPINGNTENPNLYQVQGIMNQYRNCMNKLQFSGPTYFAPLLKEAMQQCQKMKRQRRQYMLLMILTDGQIHDKEQVMDLLVKCGRLPLSVVIVGIGNGPWDIMHTLDDNDCQMRDFQGNVTQRDLVQFVQFSKYENNGVKLAKQVFFQLPRQVEDYHRLVGMVPDDYKKPNDARFQQSYISKEKIARK